MASSAATTIVFFLLGLSAGSSLAGDPSAQKNTELRVTATIGSISVWLPILRGLSVRKVDGKEAFLTGDVQRNAEVRLELMTEAKSEAGLQLFSFSLILDEACASGVDLSLCRFVRVFPAKNAYVSWIKLIHPPDLAFSMKLLALKEAGDLATRAGAPRSRYVTLLQHDHGHPYYCPPDGEFGHCRMYMKIGDDLLAVIMFRREGDISSLTPFEEIAGSMRETINQLVKEQG